jgi:hypothetical protein
MSALSRKLLLESVFGLFLFETLFYRFLVILFVSTISPTSRPRIQFELHVVDAHLLAEQLRNAKLYDHLVEN